MKFIKIYEEFTENERNFLIKRKLTYIHKNIIFNRNILNNITQDIKNYDFKKFKCEILSYGITIHTDDNFKLLLKKLSSPDINIDLSFDLSVDESRLNIIDLYFSLPEILKGLDIGYKIYKLMIEKFNFISSDYGVTNYPRHIWYKLMIDKDCYFCASKKYSIAINKNISDNLLLSIIDKIRLDIEKISGLKFEDLIFDKKLKKRYGDIKKQ